MRSKTGRQLELRAELARRDMRYRDLAMRLRERGHRVEEHDIARIIAGRWQPSDVIKADVAAVLGKPTFELFQ